MNPSLIKKIILVSLIMLIPSILALRSYSLIIQNKDDIPPSTLEKIEEFLNKRETSFNKLQAHLSRKLGDGAQSNLLYEKIIASNNKILQDANSTKEQIKEALAGIAEANVNLGNYEEALQIRRKLSEEYPESVPEVIKIHYKMGESYQARERHDDAIAAYQQALLHSAKGSLTSHIRINLGWCYYKKGEYEKAINEYSRTLQEGFLDPGTIQWAWFEIGRCRFFLKNYEDAIEAFRQVLNVNPETKLARQAKTNIEDIERLKKGGTS